ncbi:MAG TPA: glycosyltransferase family 9 protein [Fimbriimonadaceae bacterium]|nr:glycosyltransferase family 9 protein [Fimbriimonadaceae bacterium]
MAAHAASCIRRSHPEGTLVWAVEERCSAVVDAERLVTQRAVYPRERWKRGAWTPKVWGEQLRFYSGLRRFRFDIGLDLQGHSKTAICLRLSGAKRRLAVRATDGFARRLNPVLSNFEGSTHTVERQLFALRTMGRFQGGSSPIMPALTAERIEVRKQIGSEPYVVIAVGAGQPWKAYPRDQWGDVAEGLRQSGQRVVFIGGPGESAPEVDSSIDLVDRLDLALTMAVLAESDLVLAADTGAGHLAAAYGNRVVSIFGPTDPAVFRPYTERGIVLKEGEETRLVSPDLVLRAAHTLLNSDGATISH